MEGGIDDLMGGICRPVRITQRVITLDGSSTVKPTGDAHSNPPPDHTELAPATSRHGRVLNSV